MEGEFLLRVAIIGAGPSGLACALELERLGIKPTIFERYHRIGQPVERVDMLLHLAWRPVKDQLAYLARHCHLSLMPAAPLNTIIMYGPNRRSVIRKRLLGYLVYRGRSPLSLENQLAARLSTPVNFQVMADPLEMAEQFDYVVVAEGDSKTARRLGLWQELSPVIIKGATVLGQFEPRTFHLYWDTRYAGHGFGYLAPFDRGRATLHLCVGGIRPADMDDHWELFLESEKIHYPIVETYEQEFHTGRVTRHQKDNILLVGNSGGFVSSFLGLGLFPGMISGVLAARAIARHLDYERLVRQLIRHINELNDLRLVLDKLDNRSLDRLVGLLGMPVVRHLVYHSGIDVIFYLHSVLYHRAFTG
ncbi:MAG: NAD(P)/FAD-dependent oxidoreductase [Thermoanaerobacteraceae bacterium]|nr:NAD(P)/FAD-dependent oxidoreductase [Thermoanaerobacteraceae bacterium]